MVIISHVFLSRKIYLLYKKRPLPIWKKSLGLLEIKNDGIYFISCIYYIQFEINRQILIHPQRLDEKTRQIRISYLPRFA